MSWLKEFIDQDRKARREIRALERDIDRLLDAHGTTLRDEDGIGPIAAATLLCEVGDPTRFATESKFARWCGTGAVAMSSGEGKGLPVRHRVDFRGNRTVNSMLYIASITQARDNPQARAFLERKQAEGKTRREARRAHKRHLANRVIRRMWRDERARSQHLAAAAWKRYHAYSITEPSSSSISKVSLTGPGGVRRASGSKEKHEWREQREHHFPLLHAALSVRRGAF